MESNLHECRNELEEENNRLVQIINENKQRLENELESQFTTRLKVLKSQIVYPVLREGD